MDEQQKHLLHHDPAIIDQWLKGQTIEGIMYGHRNNFEDDKMMCLTICFANGETVDLWAVPGTFEGETLTEFFEQNKAPSPYLAVSRLMDKWKKDEA